MIGELFKNERPSSMPRGTTYEQYYSKPYVERWNTYQKLLRYRNGRRRQHRPFRIAGYISDPGGKHVPSSCRKGTFHLLHRS